MAEEIQFHGIRNGEDWITTQPLTFQQAEELIQSRLRGADKALTYWLEEEGDHLIAGFDDRDQPMQGNHSDKRPEYPNP
jgi:hypothetical protein